MSDPATVEEKIEAALFAQVAAMEFDEPAPQIAWPNVDFPGEVDGVPLPKPAVYLEVRHFRNSNTRLMVKGSAPHLRQGILQIRVVTPLNAGATQATVLAGQVAEQFPADLPLFESGVKVRIQTAPDVGTGSMTGDGVSWMVPVSVRYEAFA